MTTIPRTKDDLKSALPDINSTLKLKGPDASIEIHRDAYGIPHVKAESTHDAFFGQGFVAAQDRLWQMDYDRYRVYGRWAEFVGESGLEQDKMMRRFQIGATVEKDYESINAEAKAMLEAYAAGVNAFLEITNTLPIEYQILDKRPEKWEPWDCLAVYKVRHIMMGVFEGKLWRARLVNILGPEKAASLLRGYQPGHLAIVPPGTDYDGPILDGLKELSEGLEAIAWLKDSPDSGSNNWAVAGSRTASGKPIVAGDSHRGLDTPNVYYQNHISCPDFDVIGLSFPGCPGFPHFGHNANVAWCQTHAGADYQDLYVERFREDDVTLYEFMGEWKQAEIRHEVIKVRDGQTVEMNVTVTGHGPIISGDPVSGYGIAFKYTATAEPNHLAEPILEMMYATSVDEIDEAMRKWVDPCNNFVFGDIQGDIGYLNRGKVPIRSIANAWLPVPGWTGEHEWQGVIPFEELARIRNPETGYIVSANNRIVSKDYPYYIALDFTPEYRARRVTERLKPMTNATIEDMALVHADRVSIPAQVYVKLLSEVTPLDEYSAKAKEKLIDWDCSMERDAVAPTIYSAFRMKLHQALGESFFGSLSDEAFGGTGRGAPGHVRQLTSLLVTMARENDTSFLPPGTQWKSIAAQALADGVSYLRERLGDDIDSWQWGKVHQTRPRHVLSPSWPELALLLDPPSVSMGGDGDTPNAGSYSPANPFVITGLSVARYAFDLDDWNNCAWAIPLGSSGHPGSAHYADQAEIWAEVKLIPMLYDWDRIRSGADSHQTLTGSQA